MNANDLEARKEALEAELARREAKKTTSERQAAYVTGRGRASEDVEDRLDAREDVEAWGDDGERPRRGDSVSRRQAARVTRGASRRGDS